MPLCLLLNDMKTVENKNQLVEKLNENKDNLSILYFGAEWCRPCLTLKPIVESLSDTYNLSELYYVDIEEERLLCIENEIRSVPVLLFYKDNKVVHRIEGMKSKDKIEAAIKEWI